MDWWECNGCFLLECSVCLSLFRFIFLFRMLDNKNHDSFNIIRIMIQYIKQTQTK